MTLSEILENGEDVVSSMVIEGTIYILTTKNMYYVNPVKLNLIDFKHNEPSED